MYIQVCLWHSMQPTVLCFVQVSLESKGTHIGERDTLPRKRMRLLFSFLVYSFDNAVWRSLAEVLWQGRWLIPQRPLVTMKKA